MVKQTVNQEFSQFSKGLNTDANPINFPDGFSLDEVNLTINDNGTRQRRLGMDVETDYSTITTSVVNTTSNDVAFSTFKWENAGGEEDKFLSVVQCGNEIKIYDLDNTPVSSVVLYTKTYVGASNFKLMSFSSVDGILVAVNGDGNIYTYTYDGGVITESSSRIVVRDLWGVEDLYDPGTGEVDITDTNNINIRPTTLSDNHLYNLRNQSWGIPKPTIENTGIQSDPISHFQINGNSITLGGVANYPSNADTVNQAYYANSADTSSPLLKLFWARDLYREDGTTFPSSKGYFIIDLLNRGISRQEVMTANDAKFPTLILNTTNLSQDYTTGGATVTTEFAGRAWFAGFDGTITDGDSKSPRLSSYLVFSRLVKNVDDINKCYQTADPTDFDDSDLVATDGGFIRIDGAYNIRALVATGSSLIILAQNGVWRVVGGSDFGFAADNFKVEKITDEGCRSANSVVFIDGGVMYWGDSGIFAIGTDNVGNWRAQNISKNVIQTLYDSISIENKKNVSGLFDPFERKVYWVYNNTINSTNRTEELVFDVDLQAFYKNDIQEINGTTSKVVSIMDINQFKSSDVVNNVVVNGDQVQVNGIDVQETTQLRSEIVRQFLYVVVLRTTSEIQYSFSSYSNTSFLDWFTLDDTGVDAAGYVTTGYLSRDDNVRRKEIPRLMVFLERTEDGVTIDSSGEYQLTNPSSCLVQARWNWANSNNGNRWSTARQFYRYRRGYIPSGVSDPYDTGDLLLITTDRIRGSGKNVSLRFSTEAGKDMKLQAWDVTWGVGEDAGS